MRQWPGQQQLSARCEESQATACHFSSVKLPVRLQTPKTDFLVGYESVLWAYAIIHEDFSDDHCK